jgi:hypothetical protein
MDDDAGVGISVEELQRLRALDEQTNEANEKLQALQRENAAAKAGLDLADRRTGYFLRGYEGDITPEAIRSEWEAAGFAAPARNVVPQAELAAHVEMSRAMAGGEEAGSEGFLEALGKTQSAEEVLQLAGRFEMPTVYNRSE